MGTFNSREIATFIWFIAFLVFILLKPDVRESILAVIKRFFGNFNILFAVCLMMLYATILVIFLHYIGLWDVSFLKDTVLWFFIAISMMVRFVSANKDESVFKKVVIDNVKVVMVLEFLVNSYTFALMVELIIVPIFALIILLDVLLSIKEELSDEEKVTKGAQTVLGLAILVLVIINVLSDLHSLTSLYTLRSIALPPLLSILLTPYLYASIVVARYELVFLRLEMGAEREKKVKKYARMRLLIYARFSSSKLLHLLRNHSNDLQLIRTNDDVDQLVKGLTDTERKECRNSITFLYL